MLINILMKKKLVDMASFQGRVWRYKSWLNKRVSGCDGERIEFRGLRIKEIINIIKLLYRGGAPI